jgi:mannosyltransferase
LSPEAMNTHSRRTETEASDPEVIVTNLHRNYTGVSATIEALLSRQADHHRLWLVGTPLPGHPTAHSLRAALAASRRPPAGRPFRIWHVRRNAELQVACLARDVLRLPIRIVFTSVALHLHSPWPRYLINRADAIIATSERAASLVPKVAGVVPHGVDTRHFHPPACRALAWAQGRLPGRYGIGIFGRIRPGKGTDLFVEAMLRLLPRFPDFTAVVIGACKGEHRAFQADLTARIAAANLSARIRFLGEIEWAEVTEWYRRLSVVVAPARYEPFGITILEAMASGAAVVATRTGSYETVIEDGRNGFLADPGEIDGLVTSLEKLMSQPEQMLSMGVVGRQRATTLFPVEGEVEGISEIYEALWQGKDLLSREQPRPSYPQRRRAEMEAERIGR